METTVISIVGPRKSGKTTFINSLANSIQSEQKLMVKQIAMLDVKIKQTEIQNSKVEDELNSPDDDDITKDDGAAIFTLNLIK